jgi:NitT/TauT family transport system permease protein
MDALTTENETHDADAARPAERKSFWARNEYPLLGTFSMLVFLAFWEAAVAFGWVNPLFTSAPSRILSTGYEMFADGSIYPHLQVSAYEFVVGYGAAVILGVPLGILMGWYGRINAVLDPFVSALYATPRIALLPLIMIWFGIGLMSKIAIVFLGAIFPILVNTITGMRTINADFVKVARSFGASDRQMFLTVALPSSIPLLLTGLRLGLRHDRTAAADRAALRRLAADDWRVGFAALTSEPFTRPHAEERPKVASRSMYRTLRTRRHPSRRALCALLRMRSQ